MRSPATRPGLRHCVWPVDCINGWTDRGGAATICVVRRSLHQKKPEPDRGVSTMCAGDDHNCPQFELHRQKLLDDLDTERRSFLKSAFATGGGAAAAWAAGGAIVTPASAQGRPGKPTYLYLPATTETVHWGYFSKL